MLVSMRTSAYVVPKFQRRNLGKLLDIFCLDIEAVKIANLIGISEKNHR